MRNFFGGHLDERFDRPKFFDTNSLFVVKRRHGMDSLIIFEDLARNQDGILTPAKLATLECVFEAICEKNKIP